MATTEAESTDPPSGPENTDGDGDGEDDRLRSIHDELSSRPVSAEAAEADASSPWLPLESNPEIFTAFSRRVGCLPPEWSFLDVVGLDDAALGAESVPRPVAAVVLLFPCTERIYAFRAEERRRLLAEMDDRSACRSPAARRACHVEQVSSFGNACGTIAAVHALTNAGYGPTLAVAVAAREGRSRRAGREREAFPRISGPISHFRDATAGMRTARERGKALESSEALHGESDAAASNASAQTACPDRGDTKLGHHYCAFVPIEVPAEGKSNASTCREVRLVELDGTKVSPVDHGPIGTNVDGKDFLEVTVALVKKRWMGLEPDRIDFSLMALSRAGYLCV